MNTNSDDEILSDMLTEAVREAKAGEWCLYVCVALHQEFAKLQQIGRLQYSMRKKMLMAATLFSALNPVSMLSSVWQMAEFENDYRDFNHDRNAHQREIESIIDDLRKCIEELAKYYPDIVKNICANQNIRLRPDENGHLTVNYIAMMCDYGLMWR